MDRKTSKGWRAMEELKAYIILDSRKFNSVEEAEKEVERIRASIVRKKRKTKNQAKVTAYISDIDMKASEGSYRYIGSKRYGAKKTFVGILKTPTYVHIHFLIIGDGCSSMADYISECCKQRFPKKKLLTIQDLIKFEEYARNQGKKIRKF